MDNRQIVYVSVYPKSGSTWCTRLLGDALNSPTGGCMPEQDAKEIATEGQDRPGNYIVRKGHFVVVDNTIQGGRFRTADKVVNIPHRLNWENVTNEKIVFLVRDPRDVCISGAFHWNKSISQKSINQFMGRMFKGDIAKCGRWDVYYKKHLDVTSGPLNHCAAWVRYEDLLIDADKEITRILSSLSLEYDKDRIPEVVKRNSFQSRLKLIEDTEQSRRKNNMRKGIAGDWKNHFTPQMNDRMWSEFGWMMEKLGYKKD